jgi:hypothetical protein
VKSVEITDGIEGGKGWGGGKSYNGEKVWSSINHSILFSTDGPETFSIIFEISDVEKISKLYCCNKDAVGLNR